MERAMNGEEDDKDDGERTSDGQGCGVCDKRLCDGGNQLIYVRAQGHPWEKTRKPQTSTATRNTSVPCRRKKSPSYLGIIKNCGHCVLPNNKQN
jgi:hypothetical protein